MNIALKGHFLREGLRLNGHHVHNLVIRKGETLADALRAAPAPVDLVIWELFGAASDIQALGPCEQPMAAFCIDTPLNAFWLRPCVQNFDAVFVDQPQCVADFAGLAPHVSWLPLPAHTSYFQPPRPKKYDITFIGTTNAERLKRNNLLRLLRSHFELNVLTGLTIAESQEVFAASKIVLNENFFPGLTLRVLQGLAAGAAVFTERSPFGHDFGLTDFQDLVFYTPDSLLERMTEVLANYGRYAGLGAHGQETCRALYGSGPVAAELLARIPTGRRWDGPAHAEAARWHRITSELLYAQRFGGDFSRTVRALQEVARSSPGKAACAELLLGDVEARVKKGRDARAHYLRALELDPASPARLKLALLDIRQNELAAARAGLLAYARATPLGLAKVPEASLAGPPTPQGLLTLAGELAFAFGRRWDMGFNKDFPDPVPDTAFELARMSWELAPTPDALDLMRRCLPQHMRGELLPLLLAALKKGLLPDVQILETARTAYEYYDHETPATIMAALRKTK
ncbi:MULTISPECIES: glycosyltransferase [unclassified Desulfovibrio]|uniref:glycosyltransferase n=1 Tax=unclassified Desulfovibrio TaxID=2593640 RepID=UPI0013EC07F4|nr:MULTISPECIES: glycosyltransferase [unclassified Desulfovibrio]